MQSGSRAKSGLAQRCLDGCEREQAADERAAGIRSRALPLTCRWLRIAGHAGVVGIVPGIRCERRLRTGSACQQRYPLPQRDVVDPCEHGGGHVYSTDEGPLPSADQRHPQFSIEFSIGRHDAVLPGFCMARDSDENSRAFRQTQRTGSLAALRFHQVGGFGSDVESRRRLDGSQPRQKVGHGGRGDLVVEVRLRLPKVLDERSKELLREFGRVNSESVRESTFAKAPADKP